MKYKLFGRSGLRVSEICLGTMTFGLEFGWGNSKEISRKVFDYYVERGGNFFDTANYYTRGTSEKMLGEFIKPDRSRHIVATKYTLTTNPEDPNASGNHRKNMVQALHESLKRLQTDYIDIYWIHAWDYTTPADEVIRALDDMVKAGKILHVGASDTPSWVVSQANAIAHFQGWSPFIGLQLEYSLIERSLEAEYFPMMESLGLGMVAWSPLGMGVLTGKYLKAPPKESRFGINPTWGKQYVDERNNRITKGVVDLAKRIKKTPAQVALNWIRQKRPYIFPIVGAKNADQLKDNLGCLDFELTPEQIEKLDEVSRVPHSFPYDFLAKDNIRSIIFGNRFRP